MGRVGRPPSCLCGECKKCKHRIYMRGWWNSLTPEQRREKVKARDPERVRANERARYERDREARLERNREWRRRNRDKTREIGRRWSEANPEKRAAVTAVNNAVRDGRLKKSGCEICGTELRVQAHHDDYSQPLKVRWLCVLHHADVHVGKRRWAA